MASATVNQEHSGTPIANSKYSGFNVPAPGANTGITGGIVFSSNCAAARITVVLTTASVLNVTCTDGSATHKWGLDKSTALQAGDLYTFTFGVRATDDGKLKSSSNNNLTYDFEVETDGVIEQLLVDEIIGPVV